MKIDHAYQVMQIIYINPGISLKGLTSSSDFSKMTVSTMLKTLLDKKYVKVDKFQDDKRTNHYFMTDLGKNYLNEQISQVEISQFKTYLALMIRDFLEKENLPGERYFQYLFAGFPVSKIKKINDIINETLLELNKKNWKKNLSTQ